MTDWNALKDELAKSHPGSPQRVQMMSMALDEARAALDRLAALGHQFELALPSAADLAAWPRAVYRQVKGVVEHLIVEGEDELRALAPGWFGHPSMQPEHLHTIDGTKFEPPKAEPPPAVESTPADPPLAVQVDPAAPPVPLTPADQTS